MRPLKSSIILAVLLYCQPLLPQDAGVYKQTGSSGRSGTEGAVVLREIGGNINPFLIFGEDVIKVRPEVGREQIISLFEGERLFGVSGEYFGLIRREEMKNSERYPIRKVSIRVIEANDGKKYRLSEVIEYDEMVPDYYLFGNEGDLLRISADNSDIGLISGGEIVKEINLFDDSEWGYEKNAVAAFSGDGGWLAVGAMRREAVPDGEAGGRSGNPHLILYDGNLQEIFRVEAKGWSLSTVDISMNGEYMAISSFNPVMRGRISKKYTEIYNKSGEKVAEYPVMARKIIFSGDEEKVLLLSGRGELRKIGVESAEVEWEASVGMDRELVEAVEMADNGRIVAVMSGEYAEKEGRTVFQKVRVTIFGEGGKNLQAIDIQDGWIEHPLIEPLKFSKNGSELGVGFAGGWRIYRREDK